ncbi:MAG: bifunctional pyr operon transcriptional regulator/uracil phosphoribosyltransferase PyrR [Gammaproteobacteria bacterium]|nr:bifunctional pyr operon transcriptional regulator/uracil phosphoribosyltransferase PyrR [Gammaproteobacteria bacterium]
MTLDLDIPALLDDMARELTALLAAQHRDDPMLVGVHTGGVWIARELHRRLGAPGPLGELNIAFYRDDFSRIGMHPTVTPSHLPVDVADRHLILVDDILYTGRTVRAAMNEIFDYGRPASITLAVLVDRQQRELPIVADVVGTTIALGDREHVKLLGPEPLRLERGAARAGS